MTEILGLTEHEETRLPTMMASFLIINQQSEIAMQNLQKLLELMDDDNKKIIYDAVKTDLTARAKRQISLIHQEIDRM